MYGHALALLTPCDRPDCDRPATALDVDGRHVCARHALDQLTAQESPHA